MRENLEVGWVQRWEVDLGGRKGDHYQNILYEIKGDQHRDTNIHKPRL